MAQEVVIRTWCDVDFNDQLGRIDARTITWFLEDERWEIDLCATHEQKTALHQMDNLVRTYGRAWVDPTKPPKPAKLRRVRSDRTPYADAPIDHGYYDKDLKQFFCTYPECVKTEIEGIEKLQSFRMHQRRAHNIGIPETDKKE